jgi:hypothetical protein
MGNFPLQETYLSRKSNSVPPFNGEKSLAHFLLVGINGIFADKCQHFLNVIRQNAF